MKPYDVIVIGAGMIGLSTAYELARMGAKVALLESKRLGDSCSVSNTAMVFKADTEPDMGLELTCESIRRFGQLSEELEYDIGYEEKDFIGLITNEKELEEAAEQVSTFSAAGFDYRIAGAKEIALREPLVNTDGTLGGLICRQGRVDPFKFIYGYFLAARRKGMDWFPDSQVVSIRKTDTCVEVKTRKQIFQADKVVIAAGAWTREVAALVGIELPQHYVHGEAIVTEAMPKLLDGIIGGVHSTRVDMENEVTRLSEEKVWYGSDKSMECREFVIHQVHEGNVLIGQRSFARPFIYDRLSKDSFSSMVREVLQFMPVLKNASIIRSWCCPVPFTPDHRPFVGQLEEDGKIFVSSGYLSTIVLTPVMGEQVAKLVLNKKTDFNLENFSPKRLL